MPFDPDAYLKEKTTPKSSFDPDAYLQEKGVAEPGITVAEPRRPLRADVNSTYAPEQVMRTQEQGFFLPETQAPTVIGTRLPATPESETLRRSEEQRRQYDIMARQAPPIPKGPTQSFDANEFLTDPVINPVGAVIKGIIEGGARTGRGLVNYARYGVDTPEGIRGLADAGLGAASTAISLMPEVALSGALAGAITPAAGEIGQKIGGEKGRKIAETVSHYATAIPFGKRVILAMAASQAGSAGVGKVLESVKGIPDEDKARIAEAAGHAGFFGALGIQSGVIRRFEAIKQKVANGQRLDPGETNLVRQNPEVFQQLPTGIAKATENLPVVGELPKQAENPKNLESNQPKSETSPLESGKIPPETKVAPESNLSERTTLETPASTEYKTATGKTKLPDQTIVPENLRDKVVYTGKDNGTGPDRFTIREEGQPHHGADFTVGNGETIEGKYQNEVRKNKPTLSREQKRKLSDTGYSAKEIEEMKPEEAVKILGEQPKTSIAPSIGEPKTPENKGGKAMDDNVDDVGRLPSTPKDSRYEEAKTLLANRGTVDTKSLQLRLKVPYSEASEIMKRLEKDGIIETEMSEGGLVGKPVNSEGKESSPSTPKKAEKEPWEIADENVKPYAEGLRKLSDKELRAEDKKIGDAINKWANDTPTVLPDGKMNPKIGKDQYYFDLSAQFAAIGREQEARKLPSPSGSAKGGEKEGERVYVSYFGTKKVGTLTGKEDSNGLVEVKTREFENGKDVGEMTGWYNKDQIEPLSPQKSSPAPSPTGEKKEVKSPEMMTREEKDKLINKIQVVSRNVLRRKYSKLMDDYANGGVDWFDTGKFARDLGIPRDELQNVITLQKQPSGNGWSNLDFAPRPEEVVAATDKILEWHNNDKVARHDKYEAVLKKGNKPNDLNWKKEFPDLAKKYAAPKNSLPQEKGKEKASPLTQSKLDEAAKAEEADDFKSAKYVLEHNRISQHDIEFYQGTSKGDYTPQGIDQSVWRRVWESNPKITVKENSRNNADILYEGDARGYDKQQAKALKEIQAPEVAPGTELWAERTDKVQDAEGKTVTKKVSYTVEKDAISGKWQLYRRQEIGGEQRSRTLLAENYDKPKLTTSDSDYTQAQKKYGGALREQAVRDANEDFNKQEFGLRGKTQDIINKANAEYENELKKAKLFGKAQKGEAPQAKIDEIKKRIQAKYKADVDAANLEHEQFLNNKKKFVDARISEAMGETPKEKSPRSLLQSQLEETRGKEEAKAHMVLTDAMVKTFADATGKSEDEILKLAVKKSTPEEVGKDALTQIPPDIAKQIPIETKLPDDPVFAEAVKNTVGAEITPDGLKIEVVRFQKPEQSGEMSVRTGVFYLPEKKSPARSYFSTGRLGYGGKEKIEGETLLKRPLFVKGAVGGKAPEIAYDMIKGKGAYQKMRTDVLANAWTKDYMNRRPDYNGVAGLFEKYGGDQDVIGDLIQHSKEGNTLPYAIQEHIVATAVREAGYDGVLGWSKRGGQPVLSELFDVRENKYPTANGEFGIHPKFDPEGDLSTLYQEGQRVAKPFYSQLTKSVDELKQEKWNGTQLLNKLTNTAGVKKEELAWTGLDEYLKSKPNVTRKEVLDYMRENEVRVEEKVLGGIARTDMRPVLQKNGKWNVHDWKTGEELATNLDSKGMADAWIENYERQTPAGTKFSQYVEPGGKPGTYRELLITLPGESASQIAELKALSDKDRRQPLNAIEAARLTALRQKRADVAGSVYESGHFQDTPNLVAHSRVNERDIPTESLKASHPELYARLKKEGKENALAVHAEEFQNDRMNEVMDLLDEARQYRESKVVQDENHPDRWRSGAQQDKTIWFDSEKEAKDFYSKKAEGLEGEAKKLQEMMPFFDKWHELTAKAFIRYAAEKGADLVTWTTGQQQIDRWKNELQQNVDEIKVDRKGEDVKVVASKNGSEVFKSSIPLVGSVEIKGQRVTLDKIIGKANAEKVRQGEDGEQTFKGNDLSIGGEGKKVIYDQIFPNTFSKIGKKFGSSVGRTSITTSDVVAKVGRLEGSTDVVLVHTSGKERPQWYSDEKTPEEAQRVADEWNNKHARPSVHSLPITESMRRTATEQGFPLFQGKQGAIEFLKNNEATIHLFEKANQSTYPHELAHWGRRMMYWARDNAIPEKRAELDAMIKHSEAWAGVKDGNWTKPAEERFARGFERYLRDGQAPTPKLKQVFEQFKTWLTEVYQNIKGSAVDIEIPAEMKSVYDRLLGGEGKPKTFEEASARAKEKLKASNILYQEENPELSKKQQDIIDALEPITDWAKEEAMNQLREGKINAENFGSTVKKMIVDKMKEDKDLAGFIEKNPDVEKYAFNINLNRMNIDDASKQNLREVVNSIKPELQAVKGKTLTNDEVLNAAEASNLLTRVVDREDTKNIVAQITKLRQAVAAGAEGKGLTKDFVENLKVLSSYAADAGRTLQAFNIEADPRLGTVKEQIVKDLIKLGFNVDELIKTGENVNWDNRKEVAEFYRQYVKPTSRELWSEFRYINMLSSPTTHLKNAFTNAIQLGGLAPATRLVSGGVDFVSSAITGKERRHYMNEVRPYYRGVINSVPDAMKAFGDVMGERNKLGTHEISHLPTLGQAEKKYMKPIAKYNETFRHVLNALEASDAFFRTMIRAGETEALTAEYLNNGKKPNESLISQEAERRAKKYVFRDELDPENTTGQGYLLSKIDNTTQALLSAGRKVPVVRWFVPFVQTPMNIFKHGLEYSPAGLLTLAKNADKGEQFSKALIGSTVFAGAAVVAFSGGATWAVPTNSKDREDFYAQGKQPYSLKIGGKWISFTGLGPLAYPMALAAATKYYMDEAKDHEKQSVAEKAKNAIGAYAEFFTDQSYMQGLGDLIESTKLNESKFETAAANLTRQMIPLVSLQGWVTRIIDPTPRRSDNFTQKVYKGIPGFSTTLPPYRNALGEESKYPYPIVNALLPFRVSSPRDKGIDPVYDEVTRLGVKLGLPGQAVTKNKESMKLTAQEHSEFIRVAGEQFRKLMKERMSQPFYWSLDDDKKKKIIERLNDNAREAAREQVKKRKFASFQPSN